MARKKTDTDLDVAPEGIDLGTIEMMPTTGYMRVVEDSFTPSDLDPPRLMVFAARGATVPKRATSGSAAADISACLAEGDRIKAQNHLGEVELRVRRDGSLHIPAGYRVLIPTGLFMDIPNFTMVQIYPRSGTSFKKGLVLTNSVAIIDSDYVEEVFVSLTNLSGASQTIANGERIAQIVHVQLDNFQEIGSLTLPPQRKTDRAGGFGSTGA